MTTARKFKLGVLGARGRMGREIAKLLSEPRFSTRLEKVADPGSGEPFAALFEAEAIVDFSSPAAVLALVREALLRKSKTVLVVGTTGWMPAELAELEAAAKFFPILRAANFSLGVQICRMTLVAWRDYPEIRDWKVTIRDLHHAEKKDAPSGTALALGAAIGRKVIIESVREGERVGTHEITFESASEKITLIHEAKSRAVFAEGALEAAIRLLNRSPKSLPPRLLALEDLYLHRGA